MSEAEGKPISPSAFAPLSAREMYELFVKANSEQGLNIQDWYTLAGADQTIWATFARMLRDYMRGT